MKSFAYRAYTSTGKLRSGTLVAEDQTDASQRLRKDGLFAEDIREEIHPEKRAGSAAPLLGKRGLDTDLQALFARQMAVLLGSGLTVDAALQAIRSAGGARLMTDAATRVRALVLEGAPLSEALETGGTGFPAYVTSAVRAGEASRDLVTVFETIADHLESRRGDRAALATALVYPAFVAVASCIVCGILMVTVAPELAAMFEATGQPLPGLTVFMLGATDWIGTHAVLLGGLAVFMLVGTPLALRRPVVRDRWHNWLLRLPVVGRLMSLEAAAQYLRTLALVVASRQPVVDGVRSATSVLNIQKFRDESARVTTAIETGASLSAALANTTFIPGVARQLVEAGERSARVARMTERAAALVETWLVNDRKRLATLLDPALMMLIGAFVLIVVLSVILPIFDLQSGIAIG
ncbi:MAG: type II secretion system F family protein [Marinibacterium sp.]